MHGGTVKSLMACVMDCF